MKILLVDDTNTDRQIMKAYLEDLGHEVTLSKNGLEAIKLYKKDKPDLIIMDVIMPEMDGFTTAGKIRKHDSDWIPIIFLSAKVSPEDISAGIEAGGDDYLAKPVDHTVLVAKLKAMQRIAKMRHELLNAQKELEQANQELKLQVNVDGLTGLANRRHLNASLDTEISRAIRYNQPISILIADIDHFKQFNDNYGHLEGDDALKKVADSLASVCKRKTDLVARYGGEEFVVVLPDTNVDGAMLMAEALRKTVEDLKINHEFSSANDVVTLSIGVFSSIPVGNISVASMLEKADAALYQAKQSGRNQVCLAK